MTISNPIASQIKFVYDLGEIDEIVVLKSRIIKNINVDSSDEDVLKMGNDLAKLQIYKRADIFRMDTEALSL